ncbi:MAG: hypothetical protein ABSE63_17905 [Thermoguttaceae bacterium]|jgi:hypothetical protein
MKNQLGIMYGSIFVFAVITAVWPIENVLAQVKTPQSLPKFEKIEAEVWLYFQSQPNFQASMLITKEQVEPLLGGLARMGFSLPEPKTILDKLPAENEFLVAELYCPAGRKFMQGIAKYPDVYDRLDRLSRLPHGRQTVHDLINGPGGYRMIQYMSKAPNGKKLGNLLSDGQGGADFNKPTGRIYTAPMLLAQLEEQYRAMEENSAGKK